MNRPSASSALLLTLCLACKAAPVPLHVGAPEKPVTEHVFMYPVEEVLAVTGEVLIERQYPVSRDAASHKLLTDWRWLGKSFDPKTDRIGRDAGTFHLRRYFVEGQSLGPYLSVVRVFRVEREEEKPWERPETPGGDVPPEDYVLAARHRGPLYSRLLAGMGGSDPRDTGWSSFVASGSAVAARNDAEGLEPASGDEGPGRPPLYSDPDELAMARATNPNLAGQYLIPTQADLRGRQEHGIRDPLVERDVVRLLEQFPSLEFTGGAYDPAPPRAAAGSAPQAATWERERGGTPFAKGARCGEPVRGLEALRDTVLVGEQAGTREVPAAVGNLACQLAEGGKPVLLGLPVPRQEQGAIDAYLKSSGTRADEETLLAGAFWRQVPRDGRSSRAAFLLLERMRRLRAEGLKVTPFAFDVHDLKGNAREEAIAALLLERRKSNPGAVLLVLGGNYHATTKAGALWFGRFRPYGHRLAEAGVALHALDTGFARGSRWACSAFNTRLVPECRVYAYAPSEQSYSAPGKALSVELFPAGRSGEGFDGLLHVGVLSASPPVLPSRAKLEVAAR